MSPVQQERFVWRRGNRQFQAHVAVVELDEPLALRQVIRHP